MSSLRELDAAKLLKRADLPKIRLEQIHAEPGFNPAETDEDYSRRVEGLVNHLSQSGTLPPIEVRPRDEGGMWIVDGHARVDAYRRAVQAGVPLQDPKDGQVYILATVFQGNDADRNLRLITSAEGRTLTPLQQSEVMKRLRNFGWTASEIARKTNRSAEYVGQLLALGDADSSIKELVTSGQVSALVAAKAVRKHKGQAKAVLEGQLETAKAKGKTRVTATTAAAAPVKASATAPAQAQAEAKPGVFTDTQRLDFMLYNRAIVVRSSTGFSACTVGTGTEKHYSVATPIEALDAFMVELGVAA